MARGVAKVMGFNLILNFNNPYLATGLGDFWSRWHISLSTWFRDYVYIPLGGNRSGQVAHLSQSLHHVPDLRDLARRGLDIRHLGNPPRPWRDAHARIGALRVLSRARAELVKQAGVFVFVCFAWIFFRAASLRTRC